MEHAILAKELRPVFEQKIGAGQCFGSLDFYQRMDYAHMQYESASDHYEGLSSCPLIAAAEDIAHWYAEMEVAEVYEREHGPAPLSAEDLADFHMSCLRFPLRGRT